jgi:hypothetical protein
MPSPYYKGSCPAAAAHHPFEACQKNQGQKQALLLLSETRLKYMDLADPVPACSRLWNQAQLNKWR